MKLKKMVVGVVVMIKPILLGVFYGSGTVLTLYCIMSYILYSNPIKETLSLSILQMRKLKHD